MITEEAFIDFTCPECGELNSFPLTRAGMLEECVSCLASLIVPGSSEEAGRSIHVPLVTSRLVLRRFTAHDWKALLELAADDEFLTYTDGLAVQGDDEAVREEAVLHWLERDHLIKLTTPDQPFRLAIELKDGNKLMGYLRLVFADHQRLQAGFMVNLHRSYQRQGYGSEAVEALLAFCFEDLKLHRVTANFDSGHTAACRLCEKAGLRREAEFVKNYSFDGEWRNTVWFGLLEEEFRGHHGNAE
jgi:ribosomal-protein-alanine N-acetyltransferase